MMNLMKSKSDIVESKPGVLFRQKPEKEKHESVPRLTAKKKSLAATHKLAFAGLYLLTLLMYLRPQEIWPRYFGSLPITKVVAATTLLVYIISKMSVGQRLVNWTLEMKMSALMWVTGLILMPIALSPQDSFQVLFDPFIKTLLIMAMMIVLIDTRFRLRLFILTMVGCGLLFGLNAIKNYLTGNYGAAFGSRISGWGTMMQNPNDLASVLTMMLPFAIFFFLTRRGWRRLFFLFCMAIGATAVLLTYSRSGFLGTVALSGLIFWKLYRGKRLKMWVLSGFAAIFLFFAMPDSYKTRLSTIFNPEEDKLTSAQERQMLMMKAADLAFRRAIIGVGIGNFHIYSYREKPAHNSYLETAAELGLIGLIAYLLVILSPFRSLWRLERETSPKGARPDPEIYKMSICLQACFIAYIFYGFFGSVQYLFYLYFTVAYAVTLRLIHAAEVNALASQEADAQVPVTQAQGKLTGGLLWKPHRLRERWLESSSR
jgi:O-antigen ligase